MSSVTIKDIASKGFVTISEEDTLARAVSAFRDHQPHALVVLGPSGEYRGVLEERWIARSGLNPDVTKVRHLSQQAPRLTSDTTLAMAAKLMIENHMKQLPVFDREGLVGIVTDEAIIHRAVIDRFGDTRIQEIMSSDVLVVGEEATVGSVISLFRDQDISRVPVVKHGNLVGMVTVHDVVEQVLKPKGSEKSGDVVGEKTPLLNIPVDSIMHSPVITISPSASLRDADQLMRNNDISSLVVVESGRPIGIVTKRDLLEPIARMELVDMEGLTIQIVGKGTNIAKDEQDVISQEFRSFARRYKRELKGGTLFVYMKLLGRERRGSPLIQCKLHLRARNRMFVSVSEGWGIPQTFRISLDRLERRILRSKEFEHEPEFTSRFLDEVPFWGMSDERTRIEP